MGVSNALPADIALLAELDVSDVRILWINDWYDGPIEAVVEYQGGRHLMVVQPIGWVGAMPVPKCPGPFR